jgi:hypothetical protein
VVFIKKGRLEMNKRSSEYKQKAARTRARQAISNYGITKDKILNEGMSHEGMKNIGKKSWPYVLDILGIIESSGHDLWKYSKQELIREVLRLKAQIKDEV